jgi:hypothetical protein
MTTDATTMLREALRREAAIAALDVAQAAYAAAFRRVADVMTDESARMLMFRVEQDIVALLRALRAVT